MTTLSVARERRIFLGEDAVLTLPELVSLPLQWSVVISGLVPKRETAMLRMRNHPQNYDWGSRTGIQLFAGIGDASQPVAEVWMGAHPALPSDVLADDTFVALDEHLADGPDVVAGPSEPKLPFLAKFLAAEKALSIQVHPDSELARQEFAREEEAGIALDDPRRVYRDPFHKPEVVYALTPFQLMVGLRRPQDSKRLVQNLGVADLAPLVDALTNEESEERACAAAFEWVLDQRGQRVQWLDQAISRAKALVSESSESDAVAYRTLVTLHREFPGDPTVLAPLLMNVMTLEPGQALFTPARVLHSYLGGLALEVMASSDNVIRGGLSTKAVRADLVGEIVSFKPHAPEPLLPAEAAPSVKTYAPADVTDFAFDVVKVDHHEVTVGVSGPRIVLCLSGRVKAKTSNAIELERGQSAFVSAEESDVTLSGHGVAAVVYSENNVR